MSKSKTSIFLHSREQQTHFPHMSAVVTEFVGNTCTSPSKNTEIHKYEKCD